MSHSIVVVDDHVLIARALSGIIDTFRKYEVLYEVENGKALIEKFKVPKNIPDIVLLDITMPVMDGFETAMWLTVHHPEIRIMALSMQDEEETLIKMLRCGTRGYLLKNIHPTELEAALDSLISKGYYYPDWMTRKVVQKMTDDQDIDSMPKARLQDREIEFLQYAATELTYREIADRMFCSPRTVESYRDNLFGKLGFKTRIGLVVYALKKGIIK